MAKNAKCKKSVTKVTMLDNELVVVENGLLEARRVMSSTELEPVGSRIPVPGRPGSQAATKVFTQACAQLGDVAVGRQLCDFEHESYVHGVQVEPTSGPRLADSALDGQHGEQNVPLSVARMVAILRLFDGLRERVRFRVVALHLACSELEMLAEILVDFHFRPS